MSSAVREIVSVPVTERFAARRETIVDVGSRLINERGLKGLSLGAVAEEIGLGLSSVTYYFRRKELLAAACFDRTLDALEELVAKAGAEADPAARIARMIRAVALDYGDRESGVGRRLARLHELRATADPHRAALIRRYFKIFRAVRGYFGKPGDAEGRLVQVMRAQILLETAHSLPVWLFRYDRNEHERVATRLIALLTGGLAPAGARPQATAVAIGGEEGDPVGGRFLGAAIALMNERGYRGASVERIVASLNVTKGSFYHHLDAKDDLALACFRHSLGTIGRAQNVALASEGTFLDRLAIALGSLIAVQFGEGTPLLRSTALAALPPELRHEALDRSERTARRFSGMVADGIGEGSMAAVDPLLAGQLVMSALNTAIELRELSRQVAPARAIALYGALVLTGLVP